jgi:hypothetical protein
MNLHPRPAILGIVILTAIVLAGSFFYVVHMPQPHPAGTEAPSRENLLSTSTSQQSGQPALTGEISAPQSVFASSTNPPSTSDARANPISTSTSLDLAKSPLVTYTSGQYSFAFQYPSSITITTSSEDPGDFDFDLPDSDPYPELLLSVEQPDQHSIDDYFYSPSIAGGGGSEISLFDSYKQSEEDIATTTLGRLTAIETSFKCGVAYPDTIDNGDPEGETTIFAIYDNNLYQLTAPDTCSDPAVPAILKEVQRSFKFIQ